MIKSIHPRLGWSIRLRSPPFSCFSSILQVSWPRLARSFRTSGQIHPWIQTSTFIPVGWARILGRVGLAHAIASHPEGTSKILGMGGTLISLKMHTRAEPQTLRNAQGCETLRNCRVYRSCTSTPTIRPLPLLFRVVQFTNEIEMQRLLLEFDWFLFRAVVSSSFKMTISISLSLSRVI